MATLTEVREAIQQTLLNNIADINVYRRVPGDIVPPAIAIYPTTKDYLFTFGNSGNIWEFDLIVAVEGDDEAAQDPLDELIDAFGDRAIAAVLLANPKLGRDDCNIMKPITLTSYGAKITFGNDTYVGAVLHVGVQTGYR